MQRSGPSPLVLAHILAILAVLAALLTGCAMSWFVSVFACFDSCSTPEYYFAQLALAILSNSDNPYVNQQAANWMWLWTLALLLVAVVWSGGLACLEWGRRWKRLDQHSSS